ncbi:MAG: hypothetical protein FWE16_04880 [Firmicutes bacterium]|nr:hypothetical protein [Bacillota bacterium]
MKEITDEQAHKIHRIAKIGGMIGQGQFKSCYRYQNIAEQEDYAVVEDKEALPILSQSDFEQEGAIDRPNLQGAVHKNRYLQEINKEAIQRGVLTPAIHYSGSSEGRPFVIKDMIDAPVLGYRDLYQPNALKLFCIHQGIPFPESRKEQKELEQLLLDYNVKGAHEIANMSNDVYERFMHDCLISSFMGIVLDHNPDNYFKKTEGIYIIDPIEVFKVSRTNPLDHLHDASIKMKQVLLAGAKSSGKFAGHKEVKREITHRCEVAKGMLEMDAVS